MDEPIQLCPPRRVLLNGKSHAIITHFVNGPDKWELLGHLEDTVKTPVLWKRDGRFEASSTKSPLDIVGIDVGDAPASYAPFVGIIKK